MHFIHFENIKQKLQSSEASLCRSQVGGVAAWKKVGDSNRKGGTSHRPTTLLYPQWLV